MRRKKTAKANPADEALAGRIKKHGEGWLLGMCEGAAWYRSLLDEGCETVGMAKVDADLEARRRFGDRFDEEVRARG